MAEIRHLENQYYIIFFCRGCSDLDKISVIGAEWHVDCDNVVEIETRCRILIWRTFGRIQWHVIPEPRITLQGAATWWIHCHDSRATFQGAVTWQNQCHDRATLQSVRILSAILKIVFHHILLFLFLMQFRLWRVAASVSLPIHLFIDAFVFGCWAHSLRTYSISMVGPLANELSADHEQQHNDNNRLSTTESLTHYTFFCSHIFCKAFK